jgi:predicted P-loop ATPase
MRYNGTINIAEGYSARSRKWNNKKWKWSDLVEKLTTPNPTKETFKEYIKAPKSDRDKIKDVGGYVGGYLRGGKRKSENVAHRQLLTLDIDFANAEFWEDFTLQFNNAAVLHATHSHSEKQPKFRLIMPLSREVTPDEYVAVGRYIAGVIDIDLFDNTGFQPERLMFWPSSPKDVEYYARFQDGEWLDVDAVLDSYEDWTDSSLWPTSESSFDQIRNDAKKQKDPETKAGIVGVFCRTYNIVQVIEAYLKEVYIPTDHEDRYTYKDGSTSSGLVIYDEKFAYSHHGTDPCSGKLCNAFDLVRLHKFSHLDSGRSTTKSYKAMEELARNDSQVKKSVAEERFAEAKYDFADMEEEQFNEVEIDVEWTTQLEVDARGRYLSTASNLNLIFANDPHLKGLFRQNDFDGKRYLFDSVPWRKLKEPEVMKNVDYSGVRNYIETVYGISGTLKIDDALALEFERYSFHPVREYLEGIEWDGEQRIDRLLIDYFGAADTAYVREALRKMLTGAVARIFRPGIKFDYVLTLISPMQGTGKSSFVNWLAGDWFSDTFMTVQGKEALEQIQGAWLIEMAELAGLRKAEVESVKHFISKQEDTFRPAYARTSETYKRQCVFFGTTNNKDFLRDPSGNRRFLPIDIHNVQLTQNPKLIELLESQELRAQVWAEAVHLFRQGEPLFLSADAEKIAFVEQAKHSETDERKGLIVEYLDTPLPEDWEDRDVFARRAYFGESEFEPEDMPEGVQKREFVCVAEIWTECLSKNKEDMTRYNTREINDILRGLDDWEEASSTKNFNLYGKQRYYARKV